MTNKNNNENFPEYPFISTENKQLIGYTSECKHAFQCGYKICRCLNPKNIAKHCFFGWYSVGLMPDRLCEKFEENSNWKNISIYYFMNRKAMLEQLLNDDKLPSNFDKSVLNVDMINETINKPVVLFVVGIPKDTPDSEIKKRWSWINVGVNKPIVRICPSDDIEKIKKDFDHILNNIRTLGFVPNLLLEWDGVDKTLVNYILKTLQDRESVQAVNYATRLSHSKLIQNNEIMNLVNLNTDIWAYSLRDTFKGKTILCIGGGPSLQPELPLIKKYRDKFIILCATTVLRPLLKNGIIPDIIGNIDMKHDNKIYLENISNDIIDQVYLLYEVDSNHNVIDYWKGKRIILAADPFMTPIVSNLMQYIKINPNDIIHKSGTVSNMLYQYAKLLGAKQVVLIGYDLSYPTGVTHADDVDVAHEVKLVKSPDGALFLKYPQSTQVDQAIELISNDNKQIFTSKAYYTYLLELNMRITQAPIVTTIDTSHIGAKKEGAIYKPFIDVINEIPDNNAINRKDIFKNNMTPIIKASLVKKIIKNILREKNRNIIKQNHIAKKSYICMNYNVFNEINVDNIDNKLNTIINREAEEDIGNTINNALQKIKRRKI